MVDDCKHLSKPQLQQYLKNKKKTHKSIRITGSKSELCDQYLKYRTPQKNETHSPPVVASAPKSSSASYKSISSTKKSKSPTPSPTSSYYKSPSASPGAYGDSWNALSVKTYYSPKSPNTSVMDREQVIKELKIVADLKKFLDTEKPSNIDVGILQRLINRITDDYLDEYEHASDRKYKNKHDIANLLKQKTDMKTIIKMLKTIPNGNLDREWVGFDAIELALDGWSTYSFEDRRKYLKVIGRDDLEPRKNWK